MSEYPNPVLIVGGKCDGQRYRSERKTLAVPSKIEVPQGYADLEVEMVAVDSTVHRPFHHAIGGQKFSVWVPAHWSDDEAAKVVFAKVAEQWAKHLDGGK